MRFADALVYASTAVVGSWCWRGLHCMQKVSWTHLMLHRGHLLLSKVCLYLVTLCEHIICYGPVSVCPSITRQWSVKMAKLVVTQVTPYNSPGCTRTWWFILWWVIMFWHEMEDRLPNLAVLAKAACSPSDIYIWVIADVR